ncbi:bifunctional metallophosphatase/5'-nucleotidase [Halovenus rubra]|uniref:Bifunctional metallophosphatase/5'-nucleotidase n=2 Tax=Halovenus rubra TaxID=869890 RepID=A0ACC7E5X0_9EURY|nr:5'-nucleotidase C-terminal domain-containing protein [Halovenus rubra]
MTVRLLHYSDMETALDEPQQCGALVGTLAALSDEETVVIGSGDNTAPGALSLATNGRVSLPVFEAIQPDVDTFGNHDFDFGSETARELAGAAPQQWLCANAKQNGGRFASDVTQPRTLVDAGSDRIGIVGVAHPKTAVMNPAATDVEFEDPVSHIQKEAKQLRENGADFVVVTSHCGRIDEQIAKETNVDAIFGGHVHDVYESVIAGTAVVRPGRAGRYIAEVVLDKTTSTAIHQVDDGHVDQEIVETLQAKRAEHGLDEVVTTVETPIPRTEEAATTAGSRLGNLVTDALRWKAGADVALSPPGGIRSGDPLVGEITVADIVGLAPYDDDLAVVELPGHRLRDAFFAVPFGYHDDGYPESHCTHVSGARLIWDDKSGEIRQVTVGGEPLDSEQTYTLAVDDYLIETDHVNDAFDEGDVVKRQGVARDAIVEFAREVGFDGSSERRVERPRLTTAAE